jgi:hypothetical protein
MTPDTPNFPILSIEAAMASAKAAASEPQYTEDEEVLIETVSDQSANVTHN